MWRGDKTMSRIAPEWLVGASDLGSIVDPSGETSGYVRDIERQKLVSHGIENETMIRTRRIVDSNKLPAIIDLISTGVIGHGEIDHSVGRPAQQKAVASTGSVAEVAADQTGFVYSDRFSLHRSGIRIFK